MHWWIFDAAHVSFLPTIQKIVHSMLLSLTSFLDGELSKVGSTRNINRRCSCRNYSFSACFEVRTFSHIRVRRRKYAKDFVYLHCRPSEHHEKLISVSNSEITPRAPRNIKIVTSSQENQSNQIISRKWKSSLTYIHSLHICSTWRRWRRWSWRQWKWRYFS